MKTRITLLMAAVLAVPPIAAADAPGAPAPETTVAAAPATTTPPAEVAPPTEAPPPSDVAPLAPAAPATSSPVPAVEDPLAPLFLADGCSAEQVCIHQPPATVSCTAPPGSSCSSSFQGCGRVTCDGVTTRCPGYCVGDHHCFTFCGGFDGGLDASCDFGCCDCGS